MIFQIIETMSFRRFFNPRQDFTSPRYVDLEFMTRGVFIPIDDFDYDDNYFRDQRREPVSSGLFKCHFNFNAMNKISKVVQVPTKFFYLSRP